MKKKSRVKNLLINTGLLLLLLIGLALVFNNQIKNFLMKSNGDSYAVEQVSREEIENNLQKEASFDFDAVEAASLEAVLRAQLENKVLPVIGAIALPSVDINLPVFKGLENTALLYGAGTFHPEQKMGEGNYALASHRIENADILFSPLHRTQIGDSVYLTDLENIYTYEVTVSERIEPTRVEVVEEVPDKKLVTLITCGESGGITRWLVQGELKEIVSVKDADDQMAEIFNRQQKTF